MNKITTITCQATSNQQVSIPDPDGKFVLLYFYPKDDTPGCTLEGQDFSLSHATFLAHNTVIYGVSKDSLAKHEKFKAKYNFPFELISDTDEHLCQLFGVIQSKKLYGREYLGIVRSTFLISPDGDIVKHWHNVKVKGHVEAVLKEINS